MHKKQNGATQVTIFCEASVKHSLKPPIREDTESSFPVE
jgi:hypothetical protein